MFVLFAVVLWLKRGSKSLAQVVQKSDSAIHWINRNPEEKYFFRTEYVILIYALGSGHEKFGV